MPYTADGGDYEAYVPDEVVGRRFVLDGDTAADVADAEAKVSRLNTTAGTLVDTEALARLLLRAEAVASSHIEGLVVGGRRLLRFEVESELGSGRTRDVTAEEVVSNIRAMDYAVHTLAAAPVTVDGILEMHRLLLENTDRAEFGGRLRTEQNWIGGSSYNPCSAVFVPPPETDVPRLMADLCTFVNGDSLPPLAQAAVAHAQFETIHPFVDGNGRGSGPHPCDPPASWAVSERGGADQPRSGDAIRRLHRGLSAYRYDGPADGDSASKGLDDWIATFAAATSAAADQALVFEDRIETIKRGWIERLGRVRSDSGTR